MKKITINVIGPIALDIIVTLQKNNQGIRISSVSGLGGKGYNIAHTLSLFKINTCFFSMIGRDETGHIISQQLSKKNIKVYLQKISGISPVFIGVNDRFGNVLFDKIDTTLFDMQRLPTIYNPHSEEVIIVVSSTNINVLKSMLKLKKKVKGQLLILALSGSKILPEYEQYIKEFDAIVGNRKEFCSLGKMLGVGNGLINTLKKIAENYNVKMAAATDADRGISYLEKINKGTKISHLSVKKIQPISTFGAGDSFLGALVALYYGYGFNLSKCIILASQLASQVVRSKKPTIDRLPKNIKRNIF